MYELKDKIKIGICLFVLAMILIGFVILEIRVQHRWDVYEQKVISREISND